LLIEPSRLPRHTGDERCDDEPYDDEQDHIRCSDCQGSGYYVGFTDRRHCPTCDGSGFL
jgi:DnaJ-class molecular chaperone